MQYKIIVEITRETGDDYPVLEGDGKAITPKNLAIQMAHELQAGWNDAAIAGHFQVKQVILEGVEYAQS